MELTLEGSQIGPAHLETVYRTNVQRAFSAGHESLASHPVVQEVFPYQEFIAVHDARVRSDHLALETSGLSGTNVYRRDDPVWDYITPPLHYNCRCGINLLTLEEAANRGVEEARRWLRTGQPPLHPEWKNGKVPHKPIPGWGARTTSGIWRARRGPQIQVSRARTSAGMRS